MADYSVLFTYLLSFVFVVIALMAVSYFGRSIPPLQASMESTDFVRERRDNAGVCREKFRSTVDPDYLNGIQVGDLIEFRRYQMLYDHWGVYVGGGFVVHKGFDSHGRGEIKKETILDVAKGGEFRPNNLESFAEERNLKRRRTKALVAEQALAKFDQFQESGQATEYDVMKNNCEHFATECAYGTAFSVQADNAASKEQINYIGKHLSAFVHKKKDKMK